MLVGSIDVGTSSTRVVLFDEAGQIAHQAQDGAIVENLHPFQGWVEQDPLAIVESVRVCLSRVEEQLGRPLLGSVSAFGITNHRETTVAWSKASGLPLHNAIVWNDTRTQVTADRLKERVNGDKDAFKAVCGLPISSYFSAVKLVWLFENCNAVREAAGAGDLMVGTVDSWLIYNLTARQQHVTDVTNASRTMLMRLDSLAWDPELCSFFGVPLSSLPSIRSSAEVYGCICPGFAGAGVPIAGCLGDQQAAAVGQMCFERGMAKNTYGTGCFMLINTGSDKVPQSAHGLLGTVCYQLGPGTPAVYALEGSVAVAGFAVAWLIDSMSVAGSKEEFNALASSVADTGDVYFVPAFSGLFAPRWDETARGVIVGLTHGTTRAHLCRAALEAVCFATREIIESIEAGDADFRLSRLNVDGGMTASDLLCQLQADILGMPVARNAMAESTALGAAIAAGLAVGAWKDLEDVKSKRKLDLTVFNPTISPEERTRRAERWHRAVDKSAGWV